MESKQLGNKIYLRLDKGDEVLSSIYKTCQERGIQSATFSGIGACDHAVVGTYIPEKHAFLHHEKSGMFEMVSLIGNLTPSTNEQGYEVHGHAMFAILNKQTMDVDSFGGHLISARILYTGEITIEPVQGTLTRETDPRVGVEVWHF